MKQEKSYRICEKERTLDELASAYKEHGRQRDFLEILARLRPLIRKKSASEAVRRALTRDDVEQIASLAVASALLRFDPASGSFAGFVYAYIVGELDKSVQSAQAVSNGDSKLDRVLRRALPSFVSVRMNDGESHADAVQAAAAHFELTRADIDASECYRSSVRSFDADAHSECVDPSHADPSLRTLLSSVLDRLTGAERAVIECRFFSDVEMSADEIARRSGVSRANISHAERRGMSKLRAALQERGLSFAELV